MKPIPILSKDKATVDTALRTLEALKPQIKSIICIAVLKNGSMRPILSEQPLANLTLAATLLNHNVTQAMFPNQPAAMPFNVMAPQKMDA